MNEQNDDYEQVCRKALEAIAPCVVGWTEETMPVWARKLAAVVPDLQRILGLPITPQIGSTRGLPT